MDMESVRSTQLPKKTVAEENDPGRIFCDAIG
jgi:hypothetical protein